MPAAVVLCLALGAVAAALLGASAPARDLLALWLAADAVAGGGAIYPPPAALFTMRPPPDWFARAAALGQEGPVYPYLYPPLWAHLLAPVTQEIRFGSLAALLFGANAAMLAAMPLLGLRLAGAPPERLRLGALALAGAALVFSHAAPVALLQGQPQILVSFLTLLALVLAAGRRGVAGGLALGVAIALKLAPLPVALAWLVAGERRAGLAALGAAGALGLVSLALGGAQEHRAFLAALGAIDRTFLVSGAVVSLDQIVVLLGFRDALTLVPFLPGAEATGAGSMGAGWAVAAKPAWLGLAQKALLAACAVAAGRALRGAAPRRAARIWGALLTAMAVLGPIGWVYYLLVPLALLPALAAPLVPRRAVLALAPVVLLAAPEGLAMLPGAAPLAAFARPLGALLLGALFLAAARAGPPQRPEHQRPEPAP